MHVYIHTIHTYVYIHNGKCDRGERLAETPSPLALSNFVSGTRQGARKDPGQV